MQSMVDPSSTGRAAAPLRPGAAASTTALGFALLTTAIGRCAMVWSRRGLRGVSLPEASDEQLRARLRERFPQARESAPPPEMARAAQALEALLRGEPVDLTGVPLDLQDVPELDRQIYEIARTIPCGQTLTYGEIARRLGEPGLARAVGQALGRNPLPLVVPCHRVLAADGSLGGFSAHGGVATKRRLLAIEGAPAAGNLELFPVQP